MGRSRVTEPPVPIEFFCETFAVHGRTVVWRERPAAHFPHRPDDHMRFNNQRAGEPAGFRGPGGRPLVRFVYNGKTRRVALLKVGWIVRTGELPKGAVRPRDGDEWNASSDNLLVLKLGRDSFSAGGISLAQRRASDAAILKALAESNGALTLPQLSELVGQGMACACVRLARLAKNGLTCGPACDQRRRWNLTEAGRALAAASQPVLDERARDILTIIARAPAGIVALVREMGSCRLTVRGCIDMLVERGLAREAGRKFTATDEGRQALGPAAPQRPEPWLSVAAISAAAAKDVVERGHDDRTRAQLSQHGTMAAAKAAVTHRLRKRQALVFDDLDMTG